MKTLALVLLAACGASGDPKALYHVAEDNLLKSANVPATCERVYAAPTYDSARCSFATGAVVYGWASAEHGFGFTVLAQQPAPKPAAPIAEPPKSTDPDPQQKPKAPEKEKK